MRTAALLLLAAVGLYWSARVHIADAAYRAGRDLPVDSEQRWLRLTEAIDIDPGDALYWYRLGRTDFARETSEGFEQAATRFREAARRSPSWAEPQFWWGIALLKLGDPEQETFALGRLERASELAPYNVDLNTRLGDLYATRWRRRRRPEDLRRAFDAFHHLRLVEPKATSEAIHALLASPLLGMRHLDAVIPVDASDERLTLARILLESKRFRFAERVFERWLDRNAQADFDDWIGYGEALLERHDDRGDSRGRDALRRHLDAREVAGIDEALIEVRQVFRRVRRPEVEMLFWQAEESRRTGLPEISLFTCEAALEAGRPRDALEATRRYRERFPAEPEALYLAARSLEALGRHPLALKFVRDALRVRSTDDRYRKLEHRLALAEEHR